MGPLISEAQREKVHGMVERAVAAGATLVMGGHPIEGPGYFYAPTLLTNVDPDSEVAQDQLFAPVLVVIAYDLVYVALLISINSFFVLSVGLFALFNDLSFLFFRLICIGLVAVNGAGWFVADGAVVGYIQ